MNNEESIKMMVEEVEHRIEKKLNRKIKKAVEEYFDEQIPDFKE